MLQAFNKHNKLMAEAQEGKGQFTELCISVYFSVTVHNSLMTKSHSSMEGLSYFKGSLNISFLSIGLSWTITY